MSVITRATTLTQDDIEGVEDRVDLIKILSDDRELDETMNNIQCAGEEVCQNYPRIYEPDGSDVMDNNQQGNIGDCDKDPDFPPMISTHGKQPGSTRYVWAGYVYARDGYTRSFRCSNRKLYDCPGRAIIKNGEVRETKSHTHPREPHILQVEQIKQDMILRAQTDRSVGLRTIYLQACKTEPLVRSHLGLDMMLNKMKKARSRKLTASPKPKPCVKPMKNLDLNFEWSKDWLEVPSGQDKTAFCKVCDREIVSPTKIRVYNHFLSEMHKRAVLGFYCPPNRRNRMEKENGSPRDPDAPEPGDPSDADSEQEDTYAMEVLDQFQDEVKRMEATKRFKKRKIRNYASFYEEIIDLQTTPDRRARGEDDLEISERKKPRSPPEPELPRVCRPPTISVHVWDPSVGEPISGLRISLHKEEEDEAWTFVRRILTDHDGKCCDMLYGQDLTVGLYKLRLDTRSYYSERGQKSLYPYIEIVFDVQRVDVLYHFPVQVSPFAYNVSGLSKS